MERITIQLIVKLQNFLKRALRSDFYRESLEYVSLKGWVVFWKKEANSLKLNLKNKNKKVFT